MSAILVLATDEAFLRRVQSAVVTRCMATPTETGDALVQRQRYNRLVLAQPSRAAGEATRMVLAVLMNASIQAAFTGGGESAIVQGDIEYVVEQQVQLTLTDLGALLDPALAIVHAQDTHVVRDIAGSIASYVVQTMGAPEVAEGTPYGTQLRRWAARHAGHVGALDLTAARLAPFVLADPDTLAQLSLHGPDALTAAVLRVAVARVLPVLIPWELDYGTASPLIGARPS